MCGLYKGCGAVEGGNYKSVTKNPKLLPTEEVEVVVILVLVVFDRKKDKLFYNCF